MPSVIVMSHLLTSAGAFVACTHLVGGSGDMLRCERFIACDHARYHSAALFDIDQDRAINVVNHKRQEGKHQEIMDQSHRLGAELQNNPAKRCFPEAIMKG